MSTRFVQATFGREDDLLAATRAVRAAGYRIEDAYTPYAVHGLDAAMGLRPSRLTWVCFLCGVAGLIAALALQYWTSATAWPINVGGKPYDSLPAFIPIAFEITVLFAGIGVILAMFLRNGLRPGKSVSLPAPGVTDDRFALVVRHAGATRDPADLHVLLGSHGAADVDEFLTGEDEA